MAKLTTKRQQLKTTTGAQAWRMLRLQAKTTKRAWSAATKATSTADKESRKLRKMIADFPKEYKAKYEERLAILTFP